MPDFPSTLESEIRRLVREEVTPLKKELTLLRKELGRRGGTPPARPTAKTGRRARNPPPTALRPKAIRANRERLKLTQAEVAEIVGVTPVAVYFWESGRTVPSGENAEILMELKGISASEAKRRLEEVE